MKFGVREICDVVLRAKNAMKVGNKVFYKNEPVLYFDSLKTSSMESQATTVYAQGGRGNAKLIAWEGERTVTFTMEDALLSPEGFSILTGAGLIKAENKPIIIHKTEITNKVKIKDGYVEISLSEIPYIEAGKVEDFRLILTIDKNYKSNKDYYQINQNVYTDEDFLKARFTKLKDSDTNLFLFIQDENSTSGYTQATEYKPNVSYYKKQFNSSIQDDEYILQTEENLIYYGFKFLIRDSEVYEKQQEVGKQYQRANDNQDFIYVMLLDENGEVYSEPYIASEIELNSDKIYIYAQETGNDHSDTPQESDVSITRKNDISKFTNGCSVLVDYYIKKDKGAFEINITPDKFGGNFYLEASTLFRDTNGADLPAEFIIPNCKIQSNFTFTMASSGDPSTFTFTMDAFPDYTRQNKQQKVFATIQVIEQGDVLENLERLGTSHNYKSDEDYNPFLTFVREQEKYLLNSNEIPEEFNNAIFSSVDENGDIYNNGLGYKKGAFLTAAGVVSEENNDIYYDFSKHENDSINNYTVTGFIPCNNTQIFEVNGFYPLRQEDYTGVTDAYVQRVAFYNKDKEKVKMLVGTTNTNIWSIAQNEPISENEQDKITYIRVCFRNIKLSEMSVVIKDAETKEAVPTRKKNSAWEILEPEIESDEK